MRGPRRIGTKPAAAACSISSGASPPSAPISNSILRPSVGAVKSARLWPASGASIRRIAVSAIGRASQRSSFSIAATSGNRLRPHCSQAEATTPRQCVSRFAARSPSRRSTLRREATGTIRETPSSTAFCTVRSIFSPACSACTSVSDNADSRSTACHASTSTVTRSRSTTAIRPAYSPPCPSNSVNASPARKRNTRQACRAAFSGSPTSAPGVRGKGQ